MVVIHWCRESDPKHGFTNIGLTDNNLSDTGLSNLLKADRLHQVSLVGLFLSTNNIGCAGIRSLSQWLCSRDCQIVKVGLNFNPDIGCSGARLLANSIPNSSLQVLGLTSCNIGDKGCLALAAALSEPSCQITRLFLNKNPISDTGGLAMAAMLEATSESPIQSCLLRLGLSNTHISSIGSAALRKSLKINLGLERLCMYGNPKIDQHEYEKLKQTARVNLMNLRGED
jgi:hypothetical protein